MTAVSGAYAQAKQIVCTLGEQRYFLGVAALVNSLAHGGFNGIVVVGYRGERPDWLQHFAYDAASELYAITPLVGLRLMEVGGPWHLNNCKPAFVARILTEIYPEAELVYYFDTDIVLKHAWSTLADWARNGIVMVLDPADSYMSPHHAYRQAWKALAAKQGRPCRDVTGYVNGGCVGIHRDFAEFASVWSALMQELERDGADMTRMKNAHGRIEFARMDQDILNATIMATEVKLALLGSEAMGMFPWTGEILPHAMFMRKPWDRNYVLDALRGFGPGRVHLAYWQFVDGPIHPFSRFERLRKRIQVTVGHWIGLVHSRSFRDI
jgi:hypothetical protein